MKELENLKELYLDEIKKINKKGELTPADAEAAKKCLEAIEKINDLCCEYEEEEGYSERSYPRRSMMNRSRTYPMYGNRSMMPEIGYDDYMYNDYSERRGRDSMGRYTSRSHGETVKHMIHELEDMHMDAPDMRTRETISQAIDRLRNY